MLAAALLTSRRAYVSLATAGSYARQRILRAPNRLSVVCVLVALALFSACIGAQAQALDVFGQPADSAATAASAPPSAAAPPSWWIRHMPSAVRSAIGHWLHVQADFNARIESFLAQWPHGASWAAWATLVIVSFGYGSLHALGPGHGKLVVTTYLGSRRARVGDAVLLSTWTAIVQALTAIGLVLGAAWFAHAGLTRVMPHAASMEIVSYALLCATSAWAIRSSRARDRCCDEPPAVRFPRGDETGARLTVSTAVDAARPDDATTQGVYLRSPLASLSGMTSGKTSPRFQTAIDVPAIRNDASRSRLKQIFMLGLASGARPCVGAIFALVTSMAVHATAAGIAATFAMAAGVATTVALIGLGSIGANRALARVALRYRFRTTRARRALAIGAIGAILVFSALQLALLFSGAATASLY
jgi:nickel/cobalt exporter